jgi:hypothetical protein
MTRIVCGKRRKKQGKLDAVRHSHDPPKHLVDRIVQRLGGRYGIVN